MNGKTGPLPDYEQPPVIEVVCGAQFAPLPRLTAPLMGVFWQSVREGYPHLQEMPPLSLVLERFDGVQDSEVPDLSISNIPPLPRMFFIDKASNWLIQLQRDRLLHNWRKVEPDDAYPRYPVVFEKFWSAWTAFRSFCEDESIGEPTVNQLEITYINHIPAGDGWESLGDLGSIFPDVAWRTEREFLPCPESVTWRVGFPLPDSLGRLHVFLRRVVRLSDEQPVLLCELTARGMPERGDDDSLNRWFHLGREWIVRGFADLAGEQIQTGIWGRRA